jgi:hypothetical protein
VTQRRRADRCRGTSKRRTSAELYEARRSENWRAFRHAPVRAKLQRLASFRRRPALISSFTVKRILPAVVCGWLLASHGALAKSKSNAATQLQVVKGPNTEHCLDEQRLSRAVETRLRQHVFRTDVPTTLYLKVAITRADGSWSALLTMHDGAGAFLGRRSLSTAAPDCSALDDSLALVVALLVDSPPPPAVGESDEASSANASPAEASPTKVATEPAGATTTSDVKPAAREETPLIVLPRDTPAAREPWRFQLAVAGVGAIGMLPGFAPGLELGFGAKAPRLPELRLIAGWYAPREQRADEQDWGARFDALYLGLEVCPFEHERGVTVFTLCAGQAIGRTHVAAFGFDENSTSNHFNYALLARGAVQLALASHWALRLGARIELPLTRGAYSFGTAEGGQQALYQPSPVAAVLDLGLIVRL